MRLDFRPSAPGSTLLVLLALLSTGSAAPGKRPAAAAAEAQPTRMTPPAPDGPALDRAYQSIKVAGSAREAAPGLSLLGQVGELALPYLDRLLGLSLHPEVELALIPVALGLDGAASLPYAKRYLRHPERAIRWAAMRRVQKGKYDASLAEAVILAYQTESDPEIQQGLLSGLGLAPEAVHPRVQTFLRGLLAAATVPEHVLDGVAWGLGQLKDAESAPRLLELLTPERSLTTIDRVLNSVHRGQGSPANEDEIAAIAMKPGPIRLWAVDRLRFGGSFSTKNHGRHPPSIWLAAQAALDDPNPLVRGSAVLALTIPTANAPACTDLGRLSAAVALLNDPQPYVRLRVIESLHMTVLRRGIMAATASPLPLEPTTMRMLRWPADWVTLPALVEAIDDPDLEVRTRAVWMLGIATGYWYGYPDIYLLGDPTFGPATKSGYDRMIAEMKPIDARAYTVKAMESAVEAILAKPDPREMKDLFRGVRILTGRSFGWTGKATPAELAAAGPALAQWWGKNKTKHPVQWIVEAMLEGGINEVDEYSQHALERWGYGSLPDDVRDKRAQTQKPEDVAKSLEAWWKTVKVKL